MTQSQLQPSLRYVWCVRGDGPTWTGQNHHLARADLAVRLFHQLFVRPLMPDQNILLWGHSHTGNVFTLLTNLLSNHKPCGELSVIGRPLAISHLGHGVATIVRWLPTHLKLIMEAMLA